MKVYLVQNKRTGFVLLTYEDETRANIYCEDLNAALDRVGVDVDAQWFVATANMITSGDDAIVTVQTDPDGFGYISKPSKLEE
jgi:hypothetical protein